MSHYLITEEDMKMMKQVAAVQVRNELMDSKWEFEKRAGREHMFSLSSKKWSSKIVDRLKKSARHLVPTEVKTLRLTKVGCKNFACPSMIHTRNQGATDVNKMELAALVKENMLDVSDYCFEKYRRSLIQRDNPKLKTPYDSIRHLQWRKMSDGHMGCAMDLEIFRNLAMFPSTREKKYMKGVTDAPPFVLHDDNKFDMTEKYCKFKGVSYKPAENGEHNDDCYIGRGQAVSEAILGRWPRDLYR